MYKIGFFHSLYAWRARPVYVRPRLSDMTEAEHGNNICLCIGRLGTMSDEQTSRRWVDVDKEIVEVVSLLSDS